MTLVGDDFMARTEYTLLCKQVGEERAKQIISEVENEDIDIGISEEEMEELIGEDGWNM